MKPGKDMRTSYWYNNLLYGLLCHVTEAFGGGATWEELVTSRLFRVSWICDYTVVVRFLVHYSQILLCQ